MRDYGVPERAMALGGAASRVGPARVKSSRVLFAAVAVEVMAVQAIDGVRE